MKKLSIISKSLLIAMGTVGAAYADESLINTWTGFYVGLNAGIVFNHVQLKSQQLGFTDPSEACNTSANSSAYFPGIQLGYRYEFPNYFVTGLEVNATFNTNQNTTVRCDCASYPYVSDRFTFRNQMQSSIKAIVGHVTTWNNDLILPYITAGASMANVGLTYKNEGGDAYSNHSTHVGWLIGAGIEWAYWQNWSLRAEYYYADYGNSINLKIPRVYGLVDPNGYAEGELSTNNIVVAINYLI